MAWDLCKPITCSGAANDCFGAAPKPKTTFLAGGPPAQPTPSCTVVSSCSSPKFTSCHHHHQHNTHNTFNYNGCCTPAVVPTHTCTSPTFPVGCGCACGGNGEVSAASAMSVKKVLESDTFSNLKKSENEKIKKYLKNWTSDHLVVDGTGKPRFVLTNLKMAGPVVPEKWRDDKGFQKSIKVLDIYATNAEWGLGLTSDWFRKLKSVVTIREMEAFGCHLESKLPRCDRLITFVNPMGPKNSKPRHSFDKIPLTNRLVIHARYPHNTHSPWQWNKTALFPRVDVQRLQIVNARELIIVFSPISNPNLEISVASAADYDNSRERPLKQIVAWLHYSHIYEFTGTQFTIVGVNDFLKATGGLSTEYCNFKAQLERDLMATTSRPGWNNERIMKLLTEDVEFVDLKDYEKRVGKATYDLDMTFHPETWKDLPADHPWKD